MNRPRGIDDRLRRRGVVSWAIAILLLLILSCLAFTVRTRCSSESRSVASELRGEAALLLAESALDEAYAGLSEWFNSAAGRAKIAALRPAITFSVPVPMTRRLALESPDLAGAAVASGAVQIQTHLAPDSLDGDRTGTLTLKATVRDGGGWMSGATRTLSVRRRLSVRSLTVPSPFDQATLTVVHAEGLLGSDVNRALDGATTAVEALVREQDQVLRPALEQARDALETAPGVGPSVASRLDAILDREDLTVDPPPLLEEGTDDLYHRIPSRLALSTDVGRLEDLGLLDFGRRIRSAQDAIEPARRRHEQARARFEAAVREMPAAPDGPAAGRLADAAVTFAQSQVSLAAAHMTILRVVGGTLEEFDEHAGGDAEALEDAASALAVDEWRKRAHMVFRGAAGAERLARLLSRQRGLLMPRGEASGVSSPSTDREGRSLSGIVVVDDGAPLELSDIAIHGHLVIVGTGPVRLRNVVLADPARDRLIVQSEGPLTLEGTVQACLVARDRLITPSRLRIVGSLTLLSAARLAGPLSGTLVRDGDRYVRGDLFVAIAPVPEARWIERR